MPNSHVTIVGNLTADPELRFTNARKAVASFTVAVSEGKDKSASFVDVTAWESLGDNIASSLSKGQRVIVTGILRQENWEQNDGQKRSKISIIADSVGPDLRWATVTVHKVINVQAQRETPQSGEERAYSIQTARAALQSSFPGAREEPF